MAMNKDTDPIDQLFANAKQEQNRIASVAETGVEARLQGNLTNAGGAENEIWMSVLGRLCAGGGLLAAGLTVWALLPVSGYEDIASLIIEQWVFGI